MRLCLLLLSLIGSQFCLSQPDSSLQSRCSQQVFQTPGVALSVVNWEHSEDNALRYCKIHGEMERRTSLVDGQSYAIAFEMRLPEQWNQRFLFQGNGGNDGRVVPATGASANRSVSALAEGFAVISTDAGHQNTSLLGGAAFGLDPQARINYGYRANQVLTPLAKQLIDNFYGRAPAYSYFMGCSNGGRHAMVAASRLADEFDGFLAGNPGFNLPKAAIQHAWDVQHLSSLNTDIAKSLSPQTMDRAARAVLEACDDLDGFKDGMVHATLQCQEVFQLDRLQCSENGESECLDEATIQVLDKMFSGPVNSQGEALYAEWVFDAGIDGADWRRWKVQSAVGNLPFIATLGAGSLATIFTTPPTPVEPSPQALLNYLRGFDFDEDAPKIWATTTRYPESAMSFMTPPDVNTLPHLARRNKKLIVYHGASDGVFSVKDTIDWYRTLDESHQGKASEFAKLYVVPGMNHCAGGPATDRFDLLTPLVEWVEKGTAPGRVHAQVNPDNRELPAGWSTQRSRPLCPFPQVAVYSESGDKEAAESFVCQRIEPSH